MPDIEFPTSAGTSPGYLALPNSDPAAATIVLPESWLDEHIRSVCDRLALEGFVALAPDLYRGQIVPQPGEAERKPTALSVDEAEQDVRAAVEFLASQPGVEGQRVGAVGFGRGGGLVLWAAAACPEVAAAVTYYCVMPHGMPDFTGVNGPVLGHFGTADVFISLKDAKALEMELRAAGVKAIFEKYTGAGHAFFDDTDRLGTYEAQAAVRSWERTVGFLSASLVTPQPVDLSDDLMMFQGVP